MRLQKTIVILILILVSNISFGQVNDSTKNVMLEKIKSNDLFTEVIYNFKNKELPKFELSLLSGEKLNSESLKGKPTIINFWFTNCAPCIDEIPLLNEIKEKFKYDVNFISITFQDLKTVTEFLEKNIFEFSHIINSKDYLKTFGQFGYPKTLILDKNLIIIDIEKRIPVDIENEEKNRTEFITQMSDLLIELKKR